MGGRFPHVSVRACALVLVVAFVSGSALVATAPRARADHDTIPWSVPAALPGLPTAGLETAVVDSGNHSLYGVTQDRLSGGSLYSNLTFFALSDGIPFATPTLLYSSNANDLVGGLPTAYISVSEGVAVDAQGRVFVAWVRGPNYTAGAGSDVDVSTSLDQGRSWSTIARASAAGDLGDDYAPVIRVAPDGRVWVAYFQLWGSFLNVTVAVSSDHGASFSGHWNATSLPAGWSPEGLDFGIDGQGRLHLVYTVCANNLCPLAYVRSDSGSAWSPSVPLVNASLSGPTTITFDPSIAIAGSTVHVAWYDTRQAPSGFPTQYYDRSTDRGATWSVPVPISQGTSDPFSQGARIAAFGDTVMAVWGSGAGFSWAVSATGGATWYPEVDMSTAPTMGLPMIAVDGNGTFHVLAEGSPDRVSFFVYHLYWDGPPAAPSGLHVTSPGANVARLSWTAPPQADVVSYRIWRSADDITYSLAGTVDAPNTSWTDTGLANGTYWYKVTAVDATNHMSHDSAPVAAYVGPSPQPPSNALQNQLDQILALQTLTTVLLVVVLAVAAIEAFLLVRWGRRPKGPAPAAAEPHQPEDDL